MNNSDTNEIIFPVTVEDLQNEAISRIGRELTEYELRSAKEGIEFGLLFDSVLFFPL